MSFLDFTLPALSCDALFEGKRCLTKRCSERLGAVTLSARAERCAISKSSLSLRSLGHFRTVMNFRTTLAILFLSGIFRLPIYAGWTANFYADTNRATIGYSNLSDKGYATFDDALRELAKENRIEKLDLISAFDLMKEDSFQKELFFALERDAPRELKEALASAGNMHNPKMYQLAEPFRKAVLITPTVKAINSALAVHGMTISELDTEKLQFQKSKAGRRFFGMLWLTVTKLPNQALQRMPHACHVSCLGRRRATHESSLRA